MQTTMTELLKDGAFEKAMLEIEFKIQDDIAKIHHYYNNDYLLAILEQEIDEIVDLIRRCNTVEGISWIPFEYYISGIYHEMRLNPSIKKYETIKEEILAKWIHAIAIDPGSGCGC